MKPSNPLPPKLARLFLYLLPNQVRDDIRGDLREEFANLIERHDDPRRANRWYWRQSLGSCWSYLMTKERVLSAVSGILAMVSVMLLMMAVLFISNAEDGSIWQQSYWTNGSVHKLFFEPEFWTMSYSGAIFSNGLGLWVNVPSLVWFGLSLAALVGLAKYAQLSAIGYRSIALALVILPYVIGVLYFNLRTIPLHESGPVIAFMWLSIVYLALPAWFLASRYSPVRLA